MPISIWDKPAELTLAPFPFEKYALAGASKQKAYDEGEALRSSIEDEFLKIKVLPVDEPKRDAFLKGVTTKLSDLYTQSGGDYGKMASGLKELQRQVKQETTYGDVAGMMSNYVTVTEAQKEFEKASAEGKFSGLDDYVYKANIFNPLDQYNKAGGWGRDDKGIGRKINMGYMPKLPEVGKTLSDFAQQWQADKYPMGLTPYKDPFTKQFTGYLVKGTKTFVSKDEVAAGVMSYAKSAPEFKQVNKLIADATDPSEEVTISYTDPKTNKPAAFKLQGANAGIHNFYKGIAESIGEREGFKQVDLDYMWDQMSAEQRAKKN